MSWIRVFCRQCLKRSWQRLQEGVHDCPGSTLSDSSYRHVELRVGSFAKVFCPEQAKKRITPNQAAKDAAFTKPPIEACSRCSFELEPYQRRSSPPASFRVHGEMANRNLSTKGSLHLAQPRWLCMP